MSTKGSKGKNIATPHLEVICEECPKQQTCSFTELVRASANQPYPVVVLTWYRPGQHVVDEGEANTGLHKVCRGFVSVISTNGSGRQSALHLVESGSLLDATDNLLRHHTYSATAKARTTSLIAFVRSNEISQLLERNHAFTRSLLYELARQMRILEEQCTYTGPRQVLQRVVHVFLRLAENYRPQQNTHVTIPLRLNRSALAEIAGTTPETISRIMCRLQRGRFLQEGRQHVTIPDMQRLRDLLGSPSLGKSS
jgi:CRP/FNR family transcriptional regulator